MKKPLPMLVLAAAVLAPPAATAKEVTTTLTIRGWTCEGCARKTERELEKLAGVVSVAVDDEKRTARVTYDDTKVKPADLTKAVAASGFKLAK